MHAVGVNHDGFRESLGLDVVTSEDGAAWLAFLRSLVARGLSGIRLVTSDAHPGLDAGKTQNVGRVVQCVALQIRGAASGVRNGRIVRIGRGGPANAKQAQGAECCCDLPGRI